MTLNEPGAFSVLIMVWHQSQGRVHTELFTYLFIYFGTGLIATCLCVRNACVRRFTSEYQTTATRLSVVGVFVPSVWIFPTFGALWSSPASSPGSRPVQQHPHPPTQEITFPPSLSGQELDGQNLGGRDEDRGERGRRREAETDGWRKRNVVCPGCSGWGGGFHSASLHVLLMEHA